VRERHDCPDAKQPRATSEDRLVKRLSEANRRASPKRQKHSLVSIRYIITLYGNRNLSAPLRIYQSEPFFHPVHATFKPVHAPVHHREIFLHVR
jgi:hypothetical protein